MDLSFSRLGRDRRRIATMPDLAMMLAGVAAHQAASPTACAQNDLISAAPETLASFNGEVAALLTDRQPV